MSSGTKKQGRARARQRCQTCGERRRDVLFVTWPCKMPPGSLRKCAQPHMHQHVSGEHFHGAFLCAVCRQGRMFDVYV